MAVLWGILLGLSRLASDSEIIAMRASGLGIGYFVRVASIVAVAGTLLGLGNSLYLAPRANQAIIEMEQSLETSQATYEIQPRVFYEDFHNYVLYVQDVRSGTGAANWRQVFMADVSRSRQSADHDGGLGHRGERQHAGTADAAARRRARRNRGRRAGTVQYLHLHDHRFAADAGPAERRAPGAPGHGALRDAAERAARTHPGAGRASASRSSCTTGLLFPRRAWC